MGRGRGKAKKQTAVVTDHNDAANVKEEKVPVSKRRGRPQRSSKEEVEDEAIGKMGNREESARSSVTSKSSKDQSAVENGAKRKRSSQAKENSDSVKEENSSKADCRAEISVKSVGFRHIGSRRKNKPRRAAEVGVECN